MKDPAREKLPTRRLSLDPRLPARIRDGERGAFLIVSATNPSKRCEGALAVWGTTLRSVRDSLRSGVSTLGRVKVSILHIRAVFIRRGGVMRS